MNFINRYNIIYSIESSEVVNIITNGKYDILIAEDLLAPKLVIMRKLSTKKLGN